MKLGNTNLTGEKVRIPDSTAFNMKLKVAVKILEKDKIQDVSDVERVAREIHILKLIRHPHIIQLYEVRAFLHKRKDLYTFIDYRNSKVVVSHHGICIWG